MKQVRLLLLFGAIIVLSGHALHNTSKTLPARKGKDRALFFAVNEYKYKHYAPLRSELGNPIKYAHTIANFLQESFDFETEVVENPTAGTIGDKINAYAARYQTGEWDTSGQLLIYFSGHGALENLNGYFIASDSDPEKLNFTAIAYSLWRPQIALFHCKHILVAVDACFSGSFDPKWFDRSRSGYPKRPGEKSEGQKLVLNHERTTTRMFFTSATDVESPEVSKFAIKMQEGLVAGIGDDAILTSTELFSFIEKASPPPHRGEFEKDDPTSSFLFFNTTFAVPDSFNLITQDIEAWNQAKAQNTREAYSEYLRLFPKGEFLEVATLRLERLVSSEAISIREKQTTTWEDLKNPQISVPIGLALCAIGLLDPVCTGDSATSFKPICSYTGDVNSEFNSAVETFCTLAGIPFSDKMIKANLSQVLASGRVDVIPPVIWDDKTNDDDATRLAKRIVRAMHSQGYWIARGPNRFNIIYVEGFNEDGSINDNAIDDWNDRRMVIYIDEQGIPRMRLNMACTTEPGIFFTLHPLNPIGAAHIAFGQYKAWVDGLHKGVEPALVQRGYLRYYRDRNRDGKRSGADSIEVSSTNGLNQNSTTPDRVVEHIGLYGSGCFVAKDYAEHLKFMELVKTDARYIHNKGYLFMSTFLNGWNL